MKHNRVSSLLERVRAGLSRPWLVLALYLAAALLPWVLLNAQEQIRYSESPERLWPAWTLFTAIHLGLLGLLAWLTLSPPLREGGETPLIPEHPGAGRRVLAAVVFGVLALALVPGILRYQLMIWYDPMTPTKGDMVPLIESALRSFWLEHDFPYKGHEVAEWWVWLTFLPGLWLPFSVPFLAGVDIRIWSAAGLGAAGWLLFLDAAFGLVRSESWRSRAALLPAAVAPFVLLHATTFFETLPILHLGGFWLFVVAWAMCLKHGSNFLAGLFFGLCVLSRPYMVVLIPFHGVFSYWQWRDGNRSAVWRTWSAAAIAFLAVMVPFLLVDAKGVVYGTLVGYEQALTHHVESNRWTAHGYGLTGLLSEIGLYETKLLLAAILELTLLAFVAPRLRTARAMLIVSALALFLFLGFSIIPWFYTFVTPALILTVGVPAFEAGDDVPPSPAVRRRFVVVGFLFPAILLGGLIARSLFDQPERLTIQAEGGTDALFESKYLHLGFDTAGWVENTGARGFAMMRADAYFSIPVHTIDHDTVGLGLEVIEPGKGLWIDLYANGEYLGGRELLYSGPYEWSLPRGNLFVGGNAFRMRVRRDHEVPTDSPPPPTGIRFWGVELRKTAP